MNYSVKISIVTVTYNDKEHLRKTLDSLIKQKYKDYESIVVDGASSDGTVELLKEYEKKMDGKMRWVSEKDDGLYYAINKGIGMAKGEVIGLLYDEYANDDVLNKIVSCFEKTKCDVVHGDLVYMDENENIIRYWEMGTGNIKSGWMAAHPTLYVKKEVYDKYGLYNTSYRGGADYEFEVRIFKDNNLRVEYIHNVLIKMFYGGTSTNGLKGYWRSFKEGVIALRSLGVKHPILINMKRVLIVAKQFMSRKKLTI